MRTLPATVLVALVLLVCAAAATGAGRAGTAGCGPAKVWVRAATGHRFSFKWSFTALPAQCRPAFMLLSIRVNGTRYMPYTKRFPARSASGTATIVLPSFMPPGTVALASAFTADGRRSEVVEGPVGPKWRLLVPRG